MSLVPLATFKLHLRVDGTVEDTAIQVYLDGAEAAVAGYLCRPLIAAGATPAPDSHELPIGPAVVSAVMLLGAHLYENREGVVTGTIATALPLSVQFLLAPYRVWAKEPV